MNNHILPQQMAGLTHLGEDTVRDDPTKDGATIAKPYSLLTPNARVISHNF